MVQLFLMSALPDELRKV